MSPAKTHAPSSEKPAKKTASTAPAAHAPKHAAVSAKHAPAEHSCKIAVIRIRGKIGLNHQVKKTLEMLRLYRRNYCVVVADTPSQRGMIERVKDYVTYGDINESTYADLVAKRAKEFAHRQSDTKGIITYKAIEISGKKYKPFFQLHPPIHGFGRKGIKLPFSQGGSLGNRGEKINDLIMRMI